MPARRILLVEDERNIHQLLAHSLHAEGYAVDVAETAAAAQRHLDTGSYELVIADWRLPDGDGLEIADLAADRGIRTILISGYLFQIPAERVARHELLMKPMRPHELIACVEWLIGKPTEA